MYASVKALALSLGIALLVGLSLAAEAQTALPTYGIWRVQNGPDLSFGAFPSQLHATDTSIIVVGTGWDSVSAARGYYADEVVSGVAASIFFDTTDVYNYHQAADQSIAIDSRGSVFGLRTKSYESNDTVSQFGRAANYIEVISRLDIKEPLTLHIVDSNSVLAPAPRELLLAGKLLPDLKYSNPSDTLYYLHIYNGYGTDTGWLKVQAIVSDNAVGGRRAGMPTTLALVNNTFNSARSEGIFGGWRYGDTIGLIWRFSPRQSPSEFTVRRYSQRTGEEFATRLQPYRIGGEDVPQITVDPVFGRAFDVGMALTMPEPQRFKQFPEVTALDTRSGAQLWQRRFGLPDGWAAGGFDAVRVAKSGTELIYAFDRRQNYGNGPYDTDYRIEVHGLDAETGNMRWATTLALDTFGSRAHGLVPMDIAVKPGGNGYVVAGWVAERKIDVVRDLRYAYTALFFLDSLGCLVPGCREPTSLGERLPAYEIQIAPNPVPQGSDVYVRVLAAIGEVYFFTITDIAGRSASFGESRLVSGSTLSIETPFLPAGAYFLTLRPSTSGGAVVTKAFIVE